MSVEAETLFGMLRQFSVAQEDAPDGTSDADVDALARLIANWLIERAHHAAELEAALIVEISRQDWGCWDDCDPLLLCALARIAGWWRLVASARNLRDRVAPRKFGWYARLAEALGDPPAVPRPWGLDVEPLRERFVETLARSMRFA